MKGMRTNPSPQMSKADPGDRSENAQPQSPILYSLAFLGARADL